MLPFGFEERLVQLPGFFQCGDVPQGQRDPSQGPEPVGGGSVPKEAMAAEPPDSREDRERGGFIGFDADFVVVPVFLDRSPFVIREDLGGGGLPESDAVAYGTTGPEGFDDGDFDPSAVFPPFADEALG